MDIVNNIVNIRRQIDKINKDVKIIAATKTQSVEAIKLCMSSGLILAAGENKVQELTSKYVDSFRWDFIGQLQTNKVKYIIDKVELIHSVDRLPLAEKIEKECAKIGKIQDVLVEINTGNEETKGGISLDNLEEFLQSISQFSHIRIRGLMAVAPAFYGENELREVYTAVYNEFKKRQNEEFNCLSMGMSNDYMIAVECGANIVRIGRGIFGERVYAK